MSTSSSQLNRTTLSVDAIWSRRWGLAFLCPVVALPIWFLLTPFRVSGLLLFLLLGSATATDIVGRKIYNWATYTAFAWAVALNTVISPSNPQAGSIGPADCLTGAGICFLLMLIPYTLARGGAGDVKLAVAIGALVGVDDGVLVIAFTYIIAGVAIGGWTIWTHGPWTLLSAMVRRCGVWVFPASIAPPAEPQTELLQKPIPLAGFFAAATLCVAFDVPSLLRSL